MDLSSMIGAVLSKQRQKDSVLARSIVLPSIGTKNCLLSVKTPPLEKILCPKSQEIILKLYYLPWFWTHLCTCRLPVFFSNGARARALVWVSPWSGTGWLTVFQQLGHGTLDGTTACLVCKLKGWEFAQWWCEGKERMSLVQYFAIFLRFKKNGRRTLLYRIIIQTVFIAAEHLFALWVAFSIFMLHAS